MRNLYLCGAGNPEGVRLAIRLNEAQNRWEQIFILDDDPAKEGQFILGIEIIGSFEQLERADAGVDEVVNLVAGTTKGRKSAREKIEPYGISFATLIDPGVDTLGVDFGGDVTVYPDALVLAESFLGKGSVVFPRGVLGHGAWAGSGCILAPGSILNARVVIGEGVYVGTNASVLPDLKIGDWVTIGANSAVVNDLGDGVSVMGVPAQVLMDLGEVSPASPRDLGSDGSLGIEDESGPRSNKMASPALKKLRAAQKRFITSVRSKGTD